MFSILFFQTLKIRTFEASHFFQTLPNDSYPPFSDPFKNAARISFICNQQRDNKTRSIRTEGEGCLRGT